MSGCVWSVKYFSSALLSTTDLQFMFKMVKRLGLRFGLSCLLLDTGGTFGDEVAWG